MKRLNYSLVAAVSSVSIDCHLALGAKLQTNKPRRGAYRFISLLFSPSARCFAQLSYPAPGG
jgi:hypothetical protein